MTKFTSYFDYINIVVKKIEKNYLEELKVDWEKTKNKYDEIQDLFEGALNSMQNIKTDINTNYDNILNNMESTPF